MNAQMFLENFGPIANAPNGVAKLREIILSLAMQGKLVKQNPQDTPASEMLKEIKAEKQRLKTPNSLLEVKAEEMRYALPTGWEWVRFGNIAQHNSGKTLDKMRNTGYPRDYITTSNLYWGAFELDNVRQMLIRDEELERCTAIKGDLLICEGGEAGRAAVWFYDKEVCFQNHVHRARFYCGIDPYYAYRFLEKLNATGEINQYRKGVGISNMSSKALASIPFPLPPLAEQKRIVAKVDELMALCDKLEAQQQERERRFPVLSHACHACFVESPTPENLKAIFDKTGSVSTEDLRKTILTLAVQGKLVSQDANDGTGEELLDRIKKVGKRKEYSSIRSSDTFFEAPKSWSWERLGNIAFSSDSGWSPRCDSGPRTENAWGVLKVSAVSWGKYLPQENKALPSNFEGRPDCEVMDGDFLLSRANTAELVARSVIVDKTPPRLMMSDKIVRFQIPEEIDKFFLNLVNLSEWARDYYARNASGTSSSMKNVSRQVMCELPVPIPPLAEQRRIVAKVDQLMVLIDKLEEQQARKAQVAQAFAQAAVAAITGTEIKEPEKMKAPKTELISRLQTRNAPNAADPAPLTKLLTEHNGELPAKALWQRSGLEIDAFYQQLRTEMANGWIIEPEKAVMKENEAD